MYRKRYRGFESHPLRQLVCGCRDSAPATSASPRKSRDSAGPWKSLPSATEPETASPGPARGRRARLSLSPFSGGSDSSSICPVGSTKRSRAAAFAASLRTPDRLHGRFRRFVLARHSIRSGPASASRDGTQARGATRSWTACGGSQKVSRLVRPRPTGEKQGDHPRGQLGRRTTRRSAPRGESDQPTNPLE